MTLVLALVCGLVIGMVLGALGGGGSILAVPALVYILGQSAQDATTASLVVIGISSAIGAVSYHREGHVRWRVGLVFGVVGIGASFGGTALNRTVDEGVLLASFATVMAVAAAAMLATSWAGWRAHRAAGRPARGGADGTTRVTQAPRARTKIAAQVVATALLVGFLTGFLGVAGGFIVVPALVVILRYPMPVATATSLLIIALNAAVSLTIHAESSPRFDWAVLVPFTAATIVAALVGKRIAAHVSSNVLTLSFAIVLLVVAAGIGLEVAAPHMGVG